MPNSSLFRSLSDEIRRFWLARPPQLRTVASTQDFSSQLWQFGLQAGSSFERHHAEVTKLLQPLLAARADTPASFER